MRWIVLLLLFGVTVVQAAEPTVVLQPDGTAWYSAGDGTPTTVIRNVIHPPGEVPPAPPDPDDDDVDDDDTDASDTRKNAKGWAEEVDDAIGATFLSSVYGLLADQIEKGTIPANVAAVDKAIDVAAEQTWNMMPGKHVDEWKGVHRNKVLLTLTTKVIASGDNLTKAEWVGYFRDVSKGFKDSTGDAAIPTWLLPIIQVLVKMLLELLTNLFNK